MENSANNIGTDHKQPAVLNVGFVLDPTQVIINAKQLAATLETTVYVHLTTGKDQPFKLCYVIGFNEQIYAGEVVDVVYSKLQPTVTTTVAFNTTLDKIL